MTSHPRPPGPGDAPTPAATPIGEAHGLDAAAALAGQVAHDLGNLLTTLIGNAELLSERLQGDPDLAGMVARITRAAQRGTRLMDRLDLFHRATSAAVPPFEAAPLLAAYAARVAPGLPAGIVLDTRIPTALGRITLAPAGLHLALGELFSNALAALAAGGRLGLRAAPCTARPMLLIEVTDDGPGMSADALKLAATPGFGSGLAALGTGLGLAIAARIATGAGGRLEVSARPGGGTLARLSLPLS